MNRRTDPWLSVLLWQWLHQSNPCQSWSLPCSVADIQISFLGKSIPRRSISDKTTTRITIMRLKIFLAPLKSFSGAVDWPKAHPLVHNARIEKHYNFMSNRANFSWWAFAGTKTKQQNAICESPLILHPYVPQTGNIFYQVQYNRLRVSQKYPTHYPLGHRRKLELKERSYAY